MFIFEFLLKFWGFFTSFFNLLPTKVVDETEGNESTLLNPYWNIASCFSLIVIALFCRNWRKKIILQKWEFDSIEFLWVAEYWNTFLYSVFHVDWERDCLTLFSKFSNFLIPFIRISNFQLNFFGWRVMPLSFAGLTSCNWSWNSWWLSAGQSQGMFWGDYWS